MSTTWKPNQPRLASAMMVIAAASIAVADALAGAPAQPKTYVEDLARVVDSKTETKLLGYLQELEQKTGAQFIVLTVPSTKGKPIEEFALRLAEGWKLGQKGKDNGLLLVVAVRDRKYRFETGYGLEGPLPDAYLGTVGRTYLVPNFRKGNYSKGIHDAVATVLNKLEGFYNVKLTGVPKVRAPRRPVRLGPRGRAGACGTAPLLLVIVVFMLVSRLGRYWLGFWGLSAFFGHHGSHRSGGWGGGGGGGFGSFGGGGGGGFGGGGASGGW